MLEITDRYAALGIAHLDVRTMCKGQCEGTGHVPIHRDEADPQWKKLWDKAEEESPSEDGWHFVVCPDCKGTGKTPASRE